MKFLVVLLSLKLFSFMHPVHVSIMNFDYSSHNKAAEVSVKVFTDDFELAFIHNYNIMLNLGKANIHPEWRKYIDTYFGKMFSLKVNGKNSVPLLFKNYTMEEDGIKLYFTAPIKGKLRSIQMDNALLLDVFENQTNLVILSIDGKEKGYSLDYNNFKINLNTIGLKN